MSETMLSTNSLRATGVRQYATPAAGSFRIDQFKGFQGMGWALFTLVLMLGLTVAIFRVLEQKSEEAARTQFAFREAELVEAIDRRLTAYAQTLYSGVGLFKSSNEVSRDEWKTFVETLNLEVNFPGIQGLGYAEFVKPENRVQYEKQIRKEGFEGFSIQPPGDRPLYSSITFLEPFDSRNQQAFGYDMYSQETRRHAMDLARDTGSVAISGKVTLVQEITDDVQAGFLIYLPFYGSGKEPADLEERRRSIIGFVYSPFRMGDLMRGILGPGSPDVRLQIYDGSTPSDATVMYDPHAAREAHDARFVETVGFQFAEHHWTLVLSSEPAFEERHNSLDAKIVLFAGLLTSVLMFGVQWSFASTGRRAEALAAEMTESLAARSEELERSNRELEQFAYAASHDLKSPLSAIANLASWIEEDACDVLTDESKEHFVLMKSRIARLEALLESLLQYSRIGRVKHDIRYVDLAILLKDLIDLADIPPGFSLKVGPDLPNFDAAVTPLSHVIHNLVNNAIKHHHKDTGNIEIDCIDLGDSVEFTVKDDGPGIATEYHQKIFGMFATLQRRDEVEGSGMGLAMVQRYVSIYGGNLKLKSGSETSGSEFSFTWRKFCSEKAN